jgi:hypothetical protein
MPHQYMLTKEGDLYDPQKKLTWPKYERRSPIARQWEGAPTEADWKAAEKEAAKEGRPQLRLAGNNSLDTFH